MLRYIWICFLCFQGCKNPQEKEILKSEKLAEGQLSQDGLPSQENPQNSGKTNLMNFNCNSIRPWVNPNCISDQHQSLNLVIFDVSEIRMQTNFKFSNELCISADKYKIGRDNMGFSMKDLGSNGGNSGMRLTINNIESFQEGKTYFFNGSIEALSKKQDNIIKQLDDISNGNSRSEKEQRIFVDGNQHLDTHLEGGKFIDFDKRLTIENGNFNISKFPMRMGDRTTVKIAVNFLEENIGSIGGITGSKPYQFQACVTFTAKPN
jgi:hypothetical protein